MEQPPTTDPVEALAGAPNRTIAFEAVFNFRDLGGYPAADGHEVRWRQLFRADGLHRLRPHEGEQFRALGIATVVDLRTDQEVEVRGRFPAEVASVDYHHLPLFDVEPDWHAYDDVEAPDYLARRYMEMLESGGEAVGTTLELLASPGAYPLVFHCAAGKDRTGIVAAVTLALLGVPDEVIADDYAISHEAMARMNAWAEVHTPEVMERLAAYPPAVAGAQPRTMTCFLALLRERHGSLEGLARDLGVGNVALAAIRRNLLTPR
ncbi:MAG TPA: tyrosine-protein phosphatase [Acidimicrobiales bacterium]